MFKLFFIFSFFSYGAIAQEPVVKGPVSKAPAEQPLTMVEEMPEFPGGMEGLKAYMSSKLIYPKLAIDSSYEGKVYIKFVIDTAGRVTHTELIKSSRYRCLDIEALRIVKSMPKWKPGKQSGKKVAVYFSLPVSFRLPEQEPKTVQEPATQTPGPNDIHTMVQKPATYPTGGSGLEADIDLKLLRELTEQMKGFSGKIFFRIVIEKDGKASEVILLRGVADCKECDEAVKQVVLKKLKPFIPAELNGEKVRSYYNALYNFDGKMTRLNDK